MRDLIGAKGEKFRFFKLLIQILIENARLRLLLEEWIPAKDIMLEALKEHEKLHSIAVTPFDNYDASLL